MSDMATAGVGGDAAVHSYRAYGLTIASDVALPELPTGDPAASPTVRIVLGTVPEHLGAASRVGLRYEAAPDQFLLRIAGVARFLVREGNEIVIDIHPGASLHQVRVFLLGSCIGALLHQRQVLVLHAAVSRTDGGAVLFAGPSGAGKSTLLAAMLQRGHAMMVDDVCGVVRSESTTGVTVLPGFARTRLRPDSLGELAIASDQLNPRPDSDKFERQVVESFWPAPAPMRQMYVLASHDEDTVLIEELSGVEAFRMVLLNTYRPALLDGLALRNTHLGLASAVASGVRVCRVIRPRSPFRPQGLAEAIDHDLSDR